MNKKSAKIIGKKKATGKKLGRPSYEIIDEIYEKAQSLASQGLTIKQIAAVLGMGTRTLYEKQESFPHFLHSIKRAEWKG